MTFQRVFPVLLLAGSFIVLPFHSVANDLDGDEPFELKPDLVITPSRVAQSPDDSLAPVSVITREDIEISAARDLFELLRLLPGVDIVRNGGPGSQTSVFLRGGNSNHVLVMVDGVRVSSSNTGAYAWEQLPVNQIERVEVVRGPRGSLYGSDAIGGVIQVFTRSDPDSHARLGGGSFGTAELSGGFGFESDRSRLSVNAGYRNVDGFSAQNPDGFTFDPDDDGFEGSNLGIKGSTRFSAGTWGYSLLAMDTESEFDQGESDVTQFVGAMTFDGHFNPDWAYQVMGGYFNDKLESDFGFFTSEFRSRRYDFSWQNQLQFGDKSLVNFGLDYYREKGESSDSYDESRHNTGLFANLDQHFARTHVQLSARLDENSRFGSKFTGQAALGISLSEQWELLGSYGSAFRGPTLNEQFSPGFGGLFAGNPALDPESSTSGEMGLRWQHQAASFNASLYRTDVDDLIAFAGEAFQAINIAEARLQGLELEYQVTAGNWVIGANATFQSTENRATGATLLRRPDEKGSLTVDRHFDNGSWLGMEWFASGEREDFGGITLDAYQLLNLRAGWAFSNSFRLELRGDNLLDEDYEPAYGFNSGGRSWFLSLAWTP